MNTPKEIAPIDDQTELATLRRVNSELLAKSSSRKAKVTELEATVAELQSKLSAAETAAHDALITAPLRQLSEAISPVPSAWLEAFSKHFKVVSTDGVLSVATNEGEPVKDAKGQALKLERTAIASYLTETDPGSERTKLFKMITVASLASGAGVGSGQGVGRPSGQPPQSSSPFGIR